ncbi:MAG TPA: MFS transporter [Candidatus Latescibacteria bacterium]|nr:MFS transporter [Candidatus Latescibacterota bacterium]
MLYLRPPIDRPLTRTEYKRGMRDMLLLGAGLMPYGTIAGVSSAIFAGYVLHLGVDKAAIGLILSLVQATGLLQLVSFRLSDRVHPRALVLGLGSLEVLFGVSVITIPFWVPRGWEFYAVVGLLGIAWTLANTYAPTFNAWFASIVPSDMRGRYISRRTFVQYGVGIAVSLLAGKFIDLVPGMKGFGILYSVALVSGLLAFSVLYRTPLPVLGQSEEDSARGESHWRRMLAPLRHREFRSFVTFHVVWTLIAAMPGPYYTVFMIDSLKLSYSTIAVFTSTQMVIMGLGFRFWGSVVDRFGGKPMVQLLFIPAAAMPALWAFATPGMYYTVPVAMFFGGLFWAGLSISTSIMLYAIIPQNGQKSSYFAIWSVSVGLAASAAPAVGSAVMKALTDVHFVWGGMVIDNYHSLFVLATAASVIPALLIRTLPDLGAQRPGYVISQLMRGNPFLLAYNIFLLARSDSAERRANLLQALGRSHNPLAVKRIVEALGDPVPEVRRAAALALGECNQPEAVEALKKHLSDPESDIKVEAARALGKLEERTAIPLLVEALRSDRLDLCVAAAEALGRMDDRSARVALVARLESGFDRTLSPAIIEALSFPVGDGPLGDLRAVRPAVAMMSSFSSEVIRVQLLNAIARCLGEGDRFLTLNLEDPYERDEHLSELIIETRDALFSLPWPAEEELTVAITFERMALARSEVRVSAYIQTAARLAELLRKHFALVEPGSEPTTVEEACAALISLEANGQLESLQERGMTFSVLLVHRAATQTRNEIDRRSR